MTSEAPSRSRRARSGMLRRQVPEEDSTILIDVAPGAENGDSYGSTARTSERSGGQEAAGRVGSPSEPQIDFVLVWEEDLRLGRPPDSAPRDKAATHAAWRDTFLENLRAAGLHVDQRHVRNASSAVHYVLLSAPWAVLCYHAEDLRLKLPLQELPNQASHWSARLLARLGIPNVLQEDVPDVPPEYYTCEFKVSKLSRYLGSDNPDTFFSSTDRHQILFAILAKTPYGHEKKGVIGIDQLLADGVFSAAFPLHDGPFRPPPGFPQAAGLGRRQLLFQYWARWRKWSKYQPLEHVRGYFGEKVALYFAWLGFYTAWLLPAAAVGTLVFLVGCCMVSSDTPTQELCGSAEDLQMCPRCADCPFWPLSSACALAQAGRLFDHGGTVFFSAFVALWAALLLAHWRRSSAALAHRWGCSHYEDLEERPRPQFAASAPTTAPNPVTGGRGRHVPGVRHPVPRHPGRPRVQVEQRPRRQLGLAHRQLHRVAGEPGLHPRPLQDLRGPGPRPDAMGNAPHPDQVRGRLHPQGVHLPVRQLLLVAHLRGLLQGQVRGLPRQLPHLVWGPQRGVRGRGLPRGAGAGAPGHHGGQAGRQQRAGGPRPAAAGLVAHGPAAPREEEARACRGPGPLGGRLRAAALWGPVPGVPGNGAAVRLRHHLRGRVPAGAALRAAQQLGGGPPGRAQARVPAAAPGGPARAGHRHLGAHPGGHRAPGGGQQRLPAGLHLRLPAAHLLPLDPRPRPARLPQLHARACPARLCRGAQPHVQRGSENLPRTGVPGFFGYLSPLALRILRFFVANKVTRAPLLVDAYSSPSFDSPFIPRLLSGGRAEAFSSVFTRLWS
ncbi:anoctamin-7 isoform X4 [Canis lupus baileyi]|uniref:anoctamin-7 isoform X4 n=1 Tax=Canis lupus baileyi TaxID=143281 RepID=UPI0015F18594